MDRTAGTRTDEVCSSVARDEAGASLRCYFSLCVRLWLLCKLKHFGQMCFNVLAFFFFGNDAVIIKHLTGVTFNICRWF